MPFLRTRTRGTRTRFAAVSVTAVLASGLLAACGTSSGSDKADAPAGAGFPVKIKNTFGTTEIKSEPKKIVTLGFNAQDVVYALGETPVGMPKYTYGANKDGVMPWDEKYHDPAKTKLISATSDGKPAFEEIAALNPDVILAPYDGFDEATYKTLTKIAPTVAYPDQPWQTTWQDQTTLIGKAIGKSDEAAELVEETEALVAKTAKEHPEFADKSLSVAYFGSKLVNIYLPTDPRVQILNGLGFENASGVEKIAAKTDKSKFFADLSWENVSDADADVVVGYVDDLEVGGLPASSKSLTAVKNDSALILDDTQVIAGLSQPTVLSVQWTLDRILDDLADAAKNAS